jgi:hypothetical protein
VRVAALAAPVLVAVPVEVVPAEVVAAAPVVAVPVVAVAAVPVVAAPVVVVAPAAADGNGRRSNGAWLHAGAEDVILPPRSVSCSHFPSPGRSRRSDESERRS